jgi:ATP-dependent Clp protease ATP-binding subunit ClpC
LAVELSDEVINWIIKNNFQPTYGARPMRRAIQRNIEDPLSEEILKGKFKNTRKLKVTLENSIPVFTEEEAEILVSS